jgi:hypothetical protein
MPTLPELQASFAEAIRDGDMSAIVGAVVSDSPGASQRLNIYRHHFVLTLAEALRSTYPVTCRLVGKAFFGQAANGYVREAPPTSPCLFEYGGGFPDHIGSLPETRHLVYLRDVGRLEWAINVSFHAPDVTQLQAPELEGVPKARYLDLGLAFHPSCRLIASPFPIDRIWQVNQVESDDVARVDLREGGVRLLVHRQDEHVGWRKLSRSEFAFLRTLTFGGRLSDARGVALSVGGDIDVAGLLAACLEGGLFCGFSLIS